MSEFEKAMIEELKAIRLLLERQAAPVVAEQVRQVVSMSEEQRREINRQNRAAAKRVAGMR